MSRTTTSISAASGVPAPSFISVPTATGFNQGDLVFQSGADFQQFTPQASSAVFGNNVSQPILSGVLGGVGGSIGVPMSTSSTNTSGASLVRNAARLTNGNIVMVGLNSSGVAFFTIYDTSFNIVVSRTTLPNTFVSFSNVVGVVALTNGGFVIYFTENTNTRFAYAIYSNTGSVVTALTTLTDYSLSSTAYFWNCTALSNGGFAATGANTSTNVFVYGLNSTGVKQFNTTLAVNNGATTSPMITFGASGSVLVFYYSNASAYQYYLLNGVTGATLSSASFAATPSYTTLTSTATLTDGINIVLFYAPDSAGNYAFRFLNSSTYVLGSATNIVPLRVTSSNTYRNIAVRPLSSGGFILFFQPNTGWITADVATQGYIYSVFNSSGTPLATSTQTSPVPVYRSMLDVTASPSAANLSLSTLESGGNLYVFFNLYGSGFVSTTAFTQHVLIDTTTFNLVPSLGYTSALGSVSSGPGPVNFSALTPTKAGYYPAANSVTQFNRTTPTVTTPTRVTAFASHNFDICTLTNGNFVIAYRNESTFAVSASIYSPTGNLLRTISIGTGFATTQVYSVRVTPLFGGKFVVGYATSSSEISLNIISATYAITSSFTLSGLSLQLTSSGSSVGFNLGSLTSDRFVVTAQVAATAFPAYWVYSNTGTQLATANIVSTSSRAQAVNGHPSGGFSASVTGISGTTTDVYYFGETATNTFTSFGGTSISGGTSVVNTKLYINQFNRLYFSHANLAGGSGITAVLALTANGSGTYTSDGTITANSPNNQIFCIPTPYGLQALIELSTSGSTVVQSYGSGGSRLTGLGSLSIGQTASTGSAVGTPLIGNSVVVAYRNASDSDCIYFFIASLPFNNVVTLNTTTSTSDATSFASPNYPLVGVAANTVAAGGTGLVQVTGTTQLNSNYSASTPQQAFDYQTPGGLGVRGTIVGRNITLLGNTQ